MPMLSFGLVLIAVGVFNNQPLLAIAGSLLITIMYVRG